MKVLLIAKSLTKGGASSGGVNLLNALEAAGQEVIVCAADSELKSNLKRASRFAERAFERVLFDAETHCLRIGSPVFDLASLVAAHRPDVVQLCDVSGNVVLFSDIPKVKCPVVHRMSDLWPYHGPAHYVSASGWRKKVACWLLRQRVFSGEYLPDVRVAPSHWLKAQIEKGSGDLSPVRVIRNAISVTECSPKSLPGSDSLRFGFISNNVLDQRKGFLKIFSRIQALVDRGTKVSLHVYGRISERQKIFPPKIDIAYHGAFSRPDLQSVFNSFDILLCPSRLDNSPNVVCEALGHGRPVIGQGGTGMDSYIKKEFGVMTDFWSDSDSLLVEFADACEGIVSDYNKFSLCGIEYANTSLSPQVIGGAYVDLYNEVLINLERKLYR